MSRRLFLERRTYRRNRLQDAARLMPVLGVLLIFAPIFIRDTGASAAAATTTDLSQWLVYYFAVWIVLITITALVSRSLIAGEPAGPEETDVADPAGPTGRDG